MEKNVSIPEISISHNHPNDGADYFVVIPSVLKTISKALFESLPANSVKEISTIEVSYSNRESDNEDTNSFDEETQLYKAKKVHPFAKDCQKIPIYRVETDLIKIDLITCPAFQNRITYNLLANTIMCAYNIKSLVVLGTAEIDGRRLIAKLLSSHKYPTVENMKDTQNQILDKIPNLEPPAVVTGISGSFASRAAFTNVPCLVLVADAEGAFNLDMEQVNPEAMGAMAVVLNSYLELDQTGKFKTNLEKETTLKKSANGELYI